MASGWLPVATISPLDFWRTTATTSPALNPATHIVLDFTA